MALRINLIILMAILLPMQGCHYTFTGVSNPATSISIEQFFNNSDLAPANLGADFTNLLKDYYQRNSSIKVVSENGELAIEGVVTDYRLNPIAPTANNTDPNNRINAAALTRLTIAMKVTYSDSKELKNSFKDKSFSFYQDFDNNLNFQTVQEDLEKKIFEQILLDIFNATVANW